MHKISYDIVNHCQVEDADDPGTDILSHCSMKPFYTAAVSLADVYKILFLKINAFPTINLKASCDLAMVMSYAHRSCCDCITYSTCVAQRSPRT